MTKKIYICSAMILVHLASITAMMLWADGIPWVLVMTVNIVCIIINTDVILRAIPQEKLRKQRAEYLEMIQRQDSE